MHLLIDGYNLLHVGQSLAQLTPYDLERKRDHLIEQLSAYRQTKPWNITVVFDGWRGGWSTEKKERRRGIELIFSRLGETADEVIKRLVKERGTAAVVVTSDREVAKYAERLTVAVIPSDQFRERLELAAVRRQRGVQNDEVDGEKGAKKKGPSRRLSKKERRLKSALKKL